MQMLNADILMSHNGRIGCGGFCGRGLSSSRIPRRFNFSPGIAAGAFLFAWVNLCSGASREAIDSLAALLAS